MKPCQQLSSWDTFWRALRRLLISCRGVSRAATARMPHDLLSGVALLSRAGHPSLLLRCAERVRIATHRVNPSLSTYLSLSGGGGWAHMEGVMIDECTEETAGHESISPSFPSYFYNAGCVRTHTPPLFPSVTLDMNEDRPRTPAHPHPVGQMFAFPLSLSRTHCKKNN